MRTFHSDLSWKFVVAAPTMPANEFKKSVIFLLEDSPDVALGVIINRPMDRDVGEIPELAFAPELGEIEIFEGGPVGSNELKLASFVLDSTEVGAFHYAVSPQKLLSIIKSPYEIRPRAFLGYTCWSRQQLRDEIEAGMWFLSNVDMNIIFDVPPEELWRELLLREYPAIAEIDPPCGNFKAN